MQVNRSALVELAGERGVEAGQVHLDHTIRPDDRAMRIWSNTVSLISHTVMDHQASPLLQAEMACSSALALLELYPLVTTRLPGELLLPRNAHIRRAVEYVHEHAHRPITSTDLAEVAALSLRALQQAFQRQLGVSPNGYIRQVRLDRVRDALLQGDPTTTSIADVARTWGFAHAGPGLLGRLPGAARRVPPGRRSNADPAGRCNPTAAGWPRIMHRDVHDDGGMDSIRYVAIGDSFSEGIGDTSATGITAGTTTLPGLDRPPGDGHRRTRHLGAAVSYANLAVRGRLLAGVLDGQLDAALALDPAPTLLTFCAGGNDLLRPAFDPAVLIAPLEAAVERVLARGIRFALLSPADPSARLPLGALINRRGDAWADALEGLARRHDLPFVDVSRDRHLGRAEFWSGSTAGT